MKYKWHYPYTRSQRARLLKYTEKTGCIEVEPFKGEPTSTDLENSVKRGVRLEPSEIVERAVMAAALRVNLSYVNRALGPIHKKGGHC